MTILELVEKIRTEFVEDIKNGEFDNFKDMQNCYDWTAQDIRGEISYMAQEYVNNEYDEIGKTEIFVFDDGSLERYANKCYEYMSYRELKKLILKGL